MRAVLRLTMLALCGVGFCGTAKAEEPFEPSDGRVARVAVEAGVGVGGTVVGAASLGLLTYGAAVVGGADDRCSVNSFFCISPAAALGFLGAVVGAAGGLGLGVWGGGELMGAHGKLWAAYVGEGVGLGTAIGGSLLVD
jgi:hypothetical protein